MADLKESIPQTFACNFISQAYEDLQAWAKPYQNYTAAQRENATLSFQETDMFALYFFFMGWPTEQYSGLQLLINKYHLKLPPEKFTTLTKPLLTYGFDQLNEYRTSAGTKPFNYRDELTQPLLLDEPEHTNN